MFSTCSDLTPRATIPDGRMAQFMQPWIEEIYNTRYLLVFALFVHYKELAIDYITCVLQGTTYICIICPVQGAYMYKRGIRLLSINYSSDCLRSPKPHPPRPTTVLLLSSTNERRIFVQGSVSKPILNNINLAFVNNPTTLV